MDDDGLAALSIADATGAEAGGELAFTVSLASVSQAEATVDFATADGTATAGADYESASGTLTLAAGEISGTIRVRVLDDALDEADGETITVSLSGPVGATLDGASATGTIMDDDEPPVLTVADAAGDEAAGELTFAVGLSGPSGLEVTVNYATADGTATAGADYVASSGTLAFAPGETMATVTVAVLDDALQEADEETFAVSLSAPDNAALEDGEAIGTIRDDDLLQPVVAGELPAAALCVGGVPFELDVAGYFGGQGLRFSAASSVPGVGDGGGLGEHADGVAGRGGRVDGHRDGFQRLGLGGRRAGGAGGGGSGRASGDRRGPGDARPRRSGRRGGVSG